MEAYLQEEKKCPIAHMELCQSFEYQIIIKQYKITLSTTAQVINVSDISKLVIWNVIQL